MSQTKPKKRKDRAYLLARMFNLVNFKPTIAHVQVATLRITFRSTDRRSGWITRLETSQRTVEPIPYQDPQENPVVQDSVQPIRATVPDG